MDSNQSPFSWQEITTNGELWTPTECFVCGDKDINFRRYGYDPAFVHIACYNCVRIYTVRLDIEEIKLVDTID